MLNHLNKPQNCNQHCYSYRLHMCLLPYAERPNSKNGLPNGIQDPNV